jgi:hypothetical protein
VEKVKSYGAHAVSYVVSALTFVAGLNPALVPPSWARYIGAAGLLLTAAHNVQAAGAAKPGSVTTVAKVVAMFAVSAMLLASLPGCKALTPTQTIAQQVAIQYATAKFVEDKATPAERTARAAHVIEVAESLKGLAAGETATVATLEARAFAVIQNAKLELADQALANTLVAVVAQELRARVSSGVLGDEDRIRVVSVLDGIIAACHGYTLATVEP